MTTLVWVREKSLLWGGRKLYLVGGSILYTYIGFGAIDRGTNVLQVRPTTICPLNCIFCSVDAGPYSRNRVAEYIVDLETMLSTVKEIAEYKGGGVEALIDTIGEGLTYPHIVRFIKMLKEIPAISSIAIESHGATLTKNLVEALEEAGLDRINLSIDTLSPEKARLLQGVNWYRVDRVRAIAEYIARETSIDLHVTPVWIPGVNDEDVVEVVEWAYRIGAGKKYPPVTIQKYVVHKYGRRVPGVKPLSWREFWSWIRRFEESYGLRVSWNMQEWGMRRTRKYPCPYKRGHRVFVKIVAPGVFRGELLGVDSEHQVLVAVIGRGLRIGSTYLAEVIEDKDCLLIARAIREIHR